MKLLLTSNGLSNPSITRALFEMAEKPANELNLAFIPTAANVEPGDKSWLIKNLQECLDQNFKSIDVVDISALSREQWKPRLQESDVLYFGGGNSFYLMEWLRRSGLQSLLTELLKTRIYIGASAGAMVTAPVLMGTHRSLYYPEERGGNEDQPALGLVPFQVRPHLGDNDFPDVNAERLKTLSADMDSTLYGLDDMSAIKVDGEQLEIVSEGKFVAFKVQ